MSGGRVTRLVLRCANPAGVAAFYADAFEAVVEADNVRIGAQRVELAQSVGALSIGLVNATSFQHFALVVSDMAAAYARLCGITGWSAISRGGPVRLPAGAGGVTAFKFRDPEGHPLELLAFPAGCEPAVWRGVAGVVKGIDHTAITVSNTARSAAFYLGLGFRRVGGSLNEGAEQAALDGVDSPVVEVTALALGNRAPHLELLCYQRPGVVGDAREEGDVLATVACVDGVAGRGEVQDPDGHRVRLGEG